MTSAEISALIDQLCDKLGIAVSSLADLVPQMARLHIVDNAITAGIGALLVVLSVTVAGRAYRHVRAEKIDSYDDEAVAVVILWFICLAVLVIGIVMACFGVSGLAKWLAAPDAMTIETLLSLVGGAQ